MKKLTFITQFHSNIYIKKFLNIYLDLMKLNNKR